MLWAFLPTPMHLSLALHSSGGAVTSQMVFYVLTKAIIVFIYLVHIIVKPVSPWGRTLWGFLFHPLANVTLILSVFISDISTHTFAGFSLRYLFILAAD